jgi:hypothetical protein
VWRALLLHLLGWLPLLALAFALKQKLRPRRMLFAAGLVGFVGAMCAVELRRYGLLAVPASAVVLPIHDLHLDEVIEFAIIGAAGALAQDILLDRTGTTAEREPEPAEDEGPAGSDESEDERI